MAISELAGKLAPQRILTNIPLLLTRYYEVTPDASDPAQRVAFGTSGHRGTSTNGSFNEAHILAVTQAVAEHRASAGITGPLFMGPTPTPSANRPGSRRFRSWSPMAWGVRSRRSLYAHAADQPCHSGPQLRRGQQTSAGRRHRDHAQPQSSPGRRLQVQPALRRPRRYRCDRVRCRPAPTPFSKTAARRETRDSYAEAMEALEFRFHHALRGSAARSRGSGRHPSQRRSHRRRSAGRQQPARLGSDSGAVEPESHDRQRKSRPAFCLYERRQRRQNQNGLLQPLRDGEPAALKDDFDVAIGNDPDADRHGIVTASGLLNPNHYLAVMIEYLFPESPRLAARGGHRQNAGLQRPDRPRGSGHRAALVEVPVGFKYFVEGLLDGSLGFGGEESAGASFLRMNGRAWSTDKDGLIPGPAGRRDDRQNRPDAGPALCRAHRALRRNRL